MGSEMCIRDSNSDNILDLVITSCQSKLSPSIVVSPTSPSDHFLVLTSLSVLPPPPKQSVVHTYRRIKSISIERFSDDIANSVLVTQPPSTLQELVDCYNSTLSEILNKHAPIQSKLISSSQ